MVYPMVYPMVFRRSAWIPQGATSAAWVAWLPRFNPRVERLCHDGPGGLARFQVGMERMEWLICFRPKHVNYLLILDVIAVYLYYVSH